MTPSVEAQPDGRARPVREHRRTRRGAGAALSLSIGLHALVLGAASIFLAGVVREPAQPSEAISNLRIDLRTVRAATLEPLRLVSETFTAAPPFLELPLSASEPLDREAWSAIQTRDQVDVPATSSRRDTELRPADGARRSSLRSVRRTAGPALVAGAGGAASGGAVGSPGAGSGTADALGAGQGDAGASSAGVASVARAIETRTPEYPAVSRRRAEQGVVACRMHVRADGSVEFVEVLTSSGSERLDDAAVEALSQWRFAPALLQGEPIPCTVDQDIRFGLTG